MTDSNGITNFHFFQALWSVDIGTKQTKLLISPQSSDDAYIYPHWSPSGKYILINDGTVYTSRNQSDHLANALLDLKTLSISTFSKYYFYDCSWSPLVDQLACTSAQAVGKPYYIVKMDTVCPVVIIDVMGNELARLPQERNGCGLYPKWSLQGQNLAIYNDVSKNVSVINLENFQKLSSTPGYAIDWAPNCRQLLIQDDSGVSKTATPYPIPQGAHNISIVDIYSGARTYFAVVFEADWQPLGDVGDFSSVSDLQVGLMEDGTVELFWTVPESIDVPAIYGMTFDIRQADTSITDDNWSSAIQVVCEPQLGLPTRKVNCVPLGIVIPRNKEIYFTLKIIDENGNTSPSSNNTTIIDSGFRPNRNGYQFNNGPTHNPEFGYYPFPPALFDFTLVDAQIALRTLDPMVGVWYKFSNSRMNNGHCAGMAETSSLYYKVPEMINELKDGANNLFEDISLSDSRRGIAYFQAMQDANPITDYRIKQEAESTPDRTLDQILKDLSNGISSVIVYQQMLPDHNIVHAISGIAASENGNGIWTIYVYDNEVPGTVKSLTIDKNTQTWTYNSRSGGIDTHSIYVIPIELYTGKQELPPDYTFLSFGKIRQLITDLKNQRIGYIGDKFINEIPGANALSMIADSDPGTDVEYILPISQSYTSTISLGETNTYSSSLAGVAQFGPGYAISVESSDYSPQTSDDLTINPDGTHLVYQANESRDITVTMALDEKQTSSMIKIGGIDLEGDEIAINFDKSTGNLVLTNGNNGQGNYNLETVNIDSSGEKQFRAVNINISPGEAQLFENITNDKLSSIILKTDQNNDGKFDEERTIENQPEGFTSSDKSSNHSTQWLWLGVILLSIAIFIYFLVRRLR